MKCDARNGSAQDGVGERKEDASEEDGKNHKFKISNIRSIHFSKARLSTNSRRILAGMKKKN